LRMIDVLPQAAELSLGQPSALPALLSASRRLKPHVSSPLAVPGSPCALKNQGLRLTRGDLQPRSDRDLNRQLTDEWCAHKHNRNTGVNLSAKLASPSHRNAPSLGLTAGFAFRGARVTA
jgi:hypothetical protein